MSMKADLTANRTQVCTNSLQLTMYVCGKDKVPISVKHMNRSLAHLLSRTKIANILSG